MYQGSVLLMLVVLPLCCILGEHALGGGPWAALVAKWFVFWAIGVRVFLAGIMQVAHPQFTAHRIFQLQNDDAFPIVRELGIANAAAGIVAIASLVWPAFVLPIAIWGAIFYGGAAVGHIVRRDRNTNETLAMATDVFAALVLVWIVVVSFR